MKILIVLLLLLFQGDRLTSREAATTPGGSVHGTQQVSSLVSVDDGGLQNGIRWLFCNIILALMPLFLTFALMPILQTSASWYAVVKDGELSIFSSTLSASVIGSSLAQPGRPDIGTITTLLALVIVLMLSTGLFIASSFFKLKKEPVPNEKALGYGSMSCAFLSALLSLVAAYQGGFR